MLECGGTLALGPIGAARSASAIAMMAANERVAIGQLEDPATILDRFGQLPPDMQLTGSTRGATTAFDDQRRLAKGSDQMVELGRVLCLLRSGEF